MLLKVRYGLILKPFFVIKSNERSEDSYIGLADFFFRKKILMHLNIMHFLSSIEIHLLKVT